MKQLGLFSKGIARINMERIDLEKYRELTKHIHCALRNYEMSHNFNDRCYALSLLSRVASSALDAHCIEADNQDVMSMTNLLDKVHEIIKLSAASSLFMQAKSRVLH